MILKIVITVVLFLLLSDVRYTNAFKFNKLFNREHTTNRPSPVTVEFSTSIWTPGENVEVTIKTGDLSNIKNINNNVNVILDIFFNEVHGRKTLSDIKYHHQGKIKYWKNGRIESNREYKDSFKVSKYLKDGDHTVVFLVSQYIDEFASQQVLLHSISSIKVHNNPKSNVISHEHLQSSSRTATSNHPTPWLFDIVWNTVSKLPSPNDVCNLCRSSKAIQKQCDDLFKLPFPEELQLPPESKEFGGLQDQPPLTTLDVCKFGWFEDQMGRLYFKYFGAIPLQLRNPLPTYPIELINQHALKSQTKTTLLANPGVSDAEKSANGDPPNRPRLRQLQYSPAMIWSHPNILGIFKVYYSQLCRHMELESRYIFGGSKRVAALAAYHGSNGNFEQPFQRLERLRNLSKTYQFRLDLAQTISFERKDGNLVMMGVDSLGSTAILLEKVLRLAKPRYLKEWKKMKYTERVDILDEIIIYDGCTGVSHDPPTMPTLHQEIDIPSLGGIIRQPPSPQNKVYLRRHLIKAVMVVAYSNGPGSKCASLAHS
ncbi:hypothetical protein BKA69DRAFT_1128028 [Paraphysoderma sedebokerense]|nr:hypothetical protein BKA69DRAFT_1128028 [Paraphysoderma sedebokerense]